MSDVVAISRPGTSDDALDANFTRVAGNKPPFILDGLDRHSISLADQNGSAVIVHFFATWCEPCRDELPALNRLVARSDPSRLRVLTISVAEVDVRVRNFIEKMPVNFPILLDRDRSVAKSWGVSALPTTFILDRHLTPRLLIERDYDWDRVDVSELLRTVESQARRDNRNVEINTPDQSKGDPR